MPMTFKDYLRQNTKKSKSRTAQGWPGFGYYGMSTAQDNQSSGESGGEEEESKTLEPAEEQDPDFEPTDDSMEPDEVSDELDDPVGEPEEEQDPNKAGIIRTVKGAHLVYKRETDSGTFEELWVYKTGGQVRNEIETRKDILAGTDIPSDKGASEDGSQTYDVWSVGDVQMIKITGLPN